VWERDVLYRATLGRSEGGHGSEGVGWGGVWLWLWLYLH
jgi:hypothetical protein